MRAPKRDNQSTGIGAYPPPFNATRDSPARNAAITAPAAARRGEPPARSRRHEFDVDTAVVADPHGRLQRAVQRERLAAATLEVAFERRELRRRAPRRPFRRRPRGRRGPIRASRPGAGPRAARRARRATAATPEGARACRRPRGPAADRRRPERPRRGADSPSRRVSMAIRGRDALDGGEPRGSDVDGDPAAERGKDFGHQLVPRSRRKVPPRRELVKLAPGELGIRRGPQRVTAKRDAVLEDLRDLRVVLEHHAESVALILDRDTRPHRRRGGLHGNAVQGDVLAPDERAQQLVGDRTRHRPPPVRSERQLRGQVGLTRGERRGRHPPRRERRERRLERVERVAHPHAPLQSQAARPPYEPVGDRARPVRRRGQRPPLVVGPFQRDHRGGGVLADVGAARALPLGVFEEEPDVARDHAAPRRHADGDLVGFGAFSDDGVRAHELDATGPKLRRARVANGVEGRGHARRILRGRG